MDERDAAVISIYAGHCLVKCANIVLASRVLTAPRKPPGDKTKNWFSLDLEEVAPAAAELSKWRTEAQQPLMLKIYLRSTNDAGPSEPKPPGCEGDVLLEQWRLSYDESLGSSRSAEDSIESDRLKEGRMDKHSVYKKMIILTRSLYTYLRMMPSFRLFRAGQNAQSRSFDIVHQIVSGDQAYGENIPEDFQNFSFSNLRTPTGAVSIRVSYRPASMINVLEETTHAQSLPRIITDYINSPRQLVSLLESTQKAPVVTSAVSDTPIDKITGQATGQAPLLYPLCWSSKELPTYPHSVSPQIAIPSATGDCSSTNTPQGHRLLNSDSVRSYPRMKLTVDGSTGDIGILLPRKLNSKNPDSGSQTGSKAPADPSRVDHSEGESPIQPNKAAQVRDAGASANNASSLHDEVFSTDQGLTALSGDVIPEDLGEQAPMDSGETSKYPSAERSCLSAQRSDSSYTSISSNHLPFACTPPGLLSNAESGSLGMGLCDPSPPISGRDISALAIIRRPSWTSRSFDMNIPKLSDPLDPWLASRSQVASSVVPVSKPLIGIQDSSLSMMIEWEKKQKSQVAGMQQSEKLPNFIVGSSESESLPFAIDGECWNGQEGGCDDGCGLGSYGAVGTSDGSSSQSDAAVASFLRLMQDAPPLISPCTSPSMSFERAREQLRKYKVKVEGFKLDM